VPGSVGESGKEMGSERRKQLLASLAQQIGRRDWELCSETYFRATFGLPAQLQIESARRVISRYLPIFQNRWSSVGWPARLLRDVEQWVEEFGRRVPDDPKEPDPADAAFLSALDGLLLATSHMTDSLTLTSSCATAIAQAIGARQASVWMADDPEAVEYWRAGQYVPGRSILENAAALCVAEREWKDVVLWIEEQQIWTYQEIDEFVLEEALSRWIAHEMLLIIPRA
jgi:hypothetical protein